MNLDRLNALNDLLEQAENRIESHEDNLWHLAGFTGLFEKYHHKYIISKMARNRILLAMYDEILTIKTAIKLYQQ